MRKLVNKVIDFLNRIKNSILKIDFKSLKFKLWAYFSIFAISIFIILWFAQVIFLQSYYTTMKKAEVIKLSEKIYDEYKKGNFINSIDQIAYKNSIGISIVDTYGNVLYTSQIQEDDNPRNQKPNILLNNADIVNQIINSPNGKVSYTMQIDRIKSKLFVYGMLLDKSNLCLVMTSSIDPIDSTISVLKNQLTYVTIISLVFSFVISIFISEKLSKPITKMNESAKRLKSGDYDVIFEKGDYTEIDNLATTLNAATNEMATTDKLRKELIANVSHDLRTPLTMIKAYGEMIQDLSGDNKEKRQQHIKIIIDEANRLTRLINDMMDLSKLESGVIVIKKEVFSITDTIRSMLLKFRNIYESQGYKFEFNVDEDIYVLADETKIEQVLYNLISNAVNYSDDNKNIIINLIKEKYNLRVEVIDHGRGISKNKLMYIWNRYYKSGEIHKTSKTGTGLGLSIVKNILEKHGKKYGVESEENKGSKFWFELDLSEKDSDK